MNEILAGLLEYSAGLSIGVAFIAGVLTSISPCNLSTIPLLIGYIEAASTRENQSLTLKRKFALALVFILGTATTFVSMGLLFSFMGGMLSSLKEILMYVAVVIAFLMGLVLLDLMPFKLNLSLDRLINKLKIKGLKGSYTLGFLMGFTTSQCATPVLLVILAYVMLQGKLLLGGLLLFVFALGRGVPLLLIGTFSGLVMSTVKFKQYSHVFQQIMGAILIALSFYLFWVA